MDATGETDQPDQPGKPTATEREAIARRVRAARRDAGLTQPDLARLTRVGTRVISRIENGHPVETRGREDVEIALGLRHPRPGENPHRVAAPADERTVDLSAVTSTQLLAEVAARLAAAERRTEPRVRPDGPPVRVRFKTADGPAVHGRVTGRANGE